MSTTIRVLLQVAVVLLVLTVGVVAVWALVVHRPQPEARPRPEALPLVRVHPVATEDVRLDVHSTGTVRAPMVVRLAAQVPGQVQWVSPSLVVGGVVAPGDALVRIDDRDYVLAVTQARAEVARAETRVATEQAEAESAVAEWKKLGLEEEPSTLVLRRPQVAEAGAMLAAAKASLQRAELDLERTVVRAPFAARVRRDEVDVGQFVGRGDMLAEIYGTDSAEVPLPVADRELQWLRLPSLRGESEGPAPEVVVTAEFAGSRTRWRGRIMRTEGEIDPRTRTLLLVARIEDPMGDDTGAGAPPLLPGMFVSAEITGRTIENAVVVPRHALRPDDTVLVVDDGRVHIREVDVLRRERDRVVLAAGLRAGELFVVSPLEIATEGMRVRVESAAETAAGR